jgi:transposase
MEATGIYWKPVWHILSDGGFELVLANAAHVKNVPGCKTAVNDATWLADLMAHGLIRASFVPDEPTQQMRDLLRTRKQMVRERSAHTQRIQKTLEDANIKLDLVVTDILPGRPPRKRTVTLQAQYLRLRSRRGAKKAICAVAASHPHRRLPHAQKRHLL